MGGHSLVSKEEGDEGASNDESKDSDNTSGLISNLPQNRLAWG